MSDREMSGEMSREHEKQSPGEGLHALVRQHMDQSTDALDTSIIERLAAGRRQALEQTVQEPPKRTRTPVTGLGLAASVAMVAVLSTFFTGNDTTTGPTPEAEALELMAAEEPLALYEDLEFYLWLEEQEISMEPPTRAG